MLRTILFLLIFFILLVILIQTAPVQNFIRGKAVTWLEKKLHTRVAVGRIFIGFPKNVVIENVYLEDGNKDTLLSGGEIKADIAIFKLLRSQIEINEVVLKDITVKVKRELPDTIFNFQFIIDAFASNGTPDTRPSTDTSNNLTIKNIVLNKVRLVYKDAVTGNDLESYIAHFETRINLFDLAHNHFDVPRFKVDGFTAKVHQSKPLVKSEPESRDIADAKKPIPYQLNFKEVSLEKINLDYGNEVSSLFATLDLQKLQMFPDKLDFENRIIDLNDFILQGTTATIRLGRKKEARIVKKEARQEVKSQTESGWKINVASLQLDSNHLIFDDNNSPKVTKGIDYSHMDVSDLTVHLDNFFFGEDSVSGKLKDAFFFEKSGIDLQKFSGNFAYGIHGASLEDFYLKTGGSELKQNISVSYPSMEIIKNNPGKMQLDIALQKSKIAVKELVSFVPALRFRPGFSNPAAMFYINSKITGTLSDLKIDELQLAGLENTKIDVAGVLRGIPESKNLRGDLAIRSFQSSKKDIMLFLSPSSLPPHFSLPEKFNLAGTVSGSQENFKTKLNLKTSAGDVIANATGKNMSDKKTAVYEASVETRELDLGYILNKEDVVGAITSAFTVKGMGLDKTTADAIIDGTITAASIKQYTYRDLKLNGSIARQKVKVHAGIANPDIHLTLDATSDISSTYPSIHLHTVIDSIKTKALHLTKDNITYRGEINADFVNAHPDSLDGKLYITRSLLVKDDHRIKLDTLQMVAGRNDNGRFIDIKTDGINASLAGHYKISEMGKIIQQTIQPYFAITAGNDSTAIKEPYNFTLNAEIVNDHVLQTIVPDLQRFDSATFVSHFTNDSGLNATLNIPVVQIGSNHVKNLQVNAVTENKKMKVDAMVQQFTSGKNLALYNAKVTALAGDNKVDYTIEIRDRARKERYRLAGLFQQLHNDKYLFALKSDSLLLNYDRWNISPANKIELTKAHIIASDFNLHKNTEMLTINSDSSAQDYPLKISFSNFKLETLTGFIQPDSTLIGGLLNGSLILTQALQQPTFTGDLTIKDLNIRKDTAGDVRLLVNHKTADTFNAEISLSGRGNDVVLNGNYYTGNVAENFDLLLNMKQLSLSTVEAFSQGAIRESSGSVNGQFKIKGTMNQPKVNGSLNFVQASFKPSQLNNRFLIDGEKFEVDEHGIRFSDFSIKDSANNELTLNGTAATTNFSNYNFDFTIRSNNFQALNSTKKDNKLFYGRLFFSSNLNVKGTEKSPVVDGRITINDKTKLTVVLPQEEPGVTEREGVIEFVDFDNPANDSLFLKNYDTLNTLALKGMDISVNVVIRKEAELNLIVDEGSGDFLNVKGEAQLTGGVDPSGKITLAGTYELDEGSYQLTFNLLRRKFNIRKGSKIVWQGEPTKAEVNITGAYETSTAPLDLVKDQLGPASENERNTYLQKLPFEVILKMTGKLLQPIITFDIVLPGDKEYNVSPAIVSTVQTKLEMLRQETGELNKQVFALLLLNRFVGENPFNSSGSGATAETLIRQSASKLLTEQLNRLAENLVEGVDLNFDVQSSDDYTTGQRKDRTDLNVGLSKRLLNDRLTVTVGSNFELEGVQNSNRSSSNIAGNVAVNYRLSKDGRYMLKAYRKNEYQGVIDGYIIETGVGFIITIDYNQFKEIFQKKKFRRAGQKAEKQKEKAPSGTGSNP